MIVVGDAGSMLVHADDRGIDHSHRRVMTDSLCIHDPIPDAKPAATERSDCNKWCGDHSSPADRAMELLNEGPKRCH